jgi:hypothetical protein
MNNDPRILSYKGLQAEKKRLEMLIDNQKNIIRHDLDELKAEFKKEIKPAIEAANFIRKVATPLRRKETLLAVSTGLIVDFALKKIFQRSNLLFQVLFPKLIKRYSSQLLQKASHRMSFKSAKITQ